MSIPVENKTKLSRKKAYQDLILNMNKHSDEYKKMYPEKLKEYRKHKPKIVQNELFYGKAQG